MYDFFNAGAVVLFVSSVNSTLEVITYLDSSAAKAGITKEPGNSPMSRVSARKNDIIREHLFIKVSSFLTIISFSAPDRYATARGAKQLRWEMGLYAPSPDGSRISYLITSTLLLSLPNTRYPLSETAKPCSVYVPEDTVQPSSTSSFSAS